MKQIDSSCNRFDIVTVAMMVFLMTMIFLGSNVTFADNLRTLDHGLISLVSVKCLDGGAWAELYEENLRSKLVRVESNWNELTGFLALIRRF